MKPGLSPIILILTFGLTLCHEEIDHYKSRGTILGPDVRDCMCCGGWYINIDTAEYEFESLPENTNIDLQKDKFPINVKLDWQLSNKPPCPYKWINISRITRY
jgi:hypothetical protein